MTFGMGVLKGMIVTFKNFAASYLCKRDEGGIFTVQYPEEREKAIENFRNFPFLVYDGTPEKLRCVACGICERECPPKCIHIVMEMDNARKPARKPAVFDVDYGLCMNCGICEEVCPFDSIFMDHDFEVTTLDSRTDLVRHKEALSRSNEYFQKIRPLFASAIDQKRKAAEEKKKTPPQNTGGQALQPPAAQGFP